MQKLLLLRDNPRARPFHGASYTGHWVMEERPKETIDALMNFL
jgi:hypothetical protein